MPEPIGPPDEESLEVLRISGTRPLLVAFMRLQSLPMLMYDGAGRILTCSRMAEHLLVSGPRLLAHDGTDLWTIIAGRADEADPMFDLRMRLRLSGGDVADTTLAIAPLRGAEGALSGAVVFVVGMPAEYSAPEVDTAWQGVPRGASASFSDLAVYLRRLVGADYTYVAEYESDYDADLRLLASDGDGPSTADLSPAQLAGLSGRQVACVPDGLAEAMPELPWVGEMGYRAYVAVALTDGEGQRIGVLAGLWREPLEDLAGTCAVFHLMGWRAASMLGNLIAERELKESEQRYGAIFAESSMPMLLVEPSTTQIVDVNPSACAYYGYDRDELLNMSVLQIDALGAETVQGELQRALDGTRGRFGGLHRLADGRTRDVEVSIGPIIFGGRRLLYAMVHDVTDRNRMEAQLERNKRELEQVVAQRTEDLVRANTELQQASVVRDMLFANFTQELRTSLQTITGFSELMLDGMAGELSDEQQRQLRMIFDAGRRLSAFITSLLESQPPGSAEATCEPEPLDVVVLAESVVFGLASFAEEKGITLELDVQTRPIQVETDRYKLQRVLLDLISSAVRYTQRGGVKVALRRDGEDANVIAVTDTGTHIGDTGSREGDGRADLAEKQSMAERLGATLEYTSEPGGATVLTLVLPDQCPVARAAAEARGEG